MPKLVKKVTHDFTVINNKIFRDQKLKGIDRGILGTMLSLADGWNFSIKGLAAILPDGETAISNSLKRIANAHYLIRRRVYKNGKITDWEYIISDEPMEFDDESDTSETVSDTVENSSFFVPDLDVEKLDLENQDVGNQDFENPHNYKITKNKESNNKKSIDKESIYQSVSETAVEKTDGQIDRYLQEQKLYTEVVKENISYNDYADWIRLFVKDSSMSVEELDEIVGIIVREICSLKKTGIICGQEYPREVIKSAMLKIDKTCVENALEIMRQTEDIRNYEKYLISTLFNEANGRHFKDNAVQRNIDYAVKRDIHRLY